MLYQQRGEPSLIGKDPRECASFFPSVMHPVHIGGRDRQIDKDTWVNLHLVAPFEKGKGPGELILCAVRQDHVHPFRSDAIGFSWRRLDGLQFSPAKLDSGVGSIFECRTQHAERKSVLTEQIEPAFRMVRICGGHWLCFRLWLLFGRFCHQIMPRDKRTIRAAARHAPSARSSSQNGWRILNCRPQLPSFRAGPCDLSAQSHSSSFSRSTK